MAAALDSAFPAARPCHDHEGGERLQGPAAHGERKGFFHGPMHPLQLGGKEKEGRISEEGRFSSGDKGGSDTCCPWEIGGGSGVLVLLCTW